MANKESWVWILILILIVPGGLLIYGGKFAGLFSTLPEGQFISNSDCSFITNVNYGTNGEQVADYSSGWISVDVNKDKTLEAYYYAGNTLASNDYCSNKAIITYTPVGLRVVTYSTTTSYTEIGVCSSDGRTIYRYRNILPSGSSSTSTPLLSCSPTTTCTPKTCSALGYSCGSVSDGCGNTLSCGTCSSGICSAGQCVANPVSCISSDTNCNGIVDRTELGTAITKWISGAMTRTDLGAAIQSWASS